VRSHHTDNVWNNCHYAKNGKGAVAFYGMEASSVWDNCEFFHNGGPAFDHFPIHKKLGDGKDVGPRPESGADVLVIRHCVIRNHPGPVWLQRAGHSGSIVFADNRIKHNLAPEECSLTRGSGKTAEELFDLTGPAGVFHVEKGKRNVELRGGFAWDNTPYLFTASPHSDPGSSILISGSAEQGGIQGRIHIPNGYCTILNAALLEDEAVVNVRSGIRKTNCGGNTRLFHGWEGQQLTDTNWKPLGIVMQADAEFGESPGGLQAPHVIRQDGTYYMFYGDWANICMPTSQDGKRFTRVMQTNGKTGMFNEGAGEHARDPMILKVGTRFHCYYTAHSMRSPEKNHRGVNYCRLHHADPSGGRKRARRLRRRPTPRLHEDNAYGRSRGAL
jgi:hypothetical protein